MTLALLVPLAPIASAIESSDLHGLSVSMEQIAEPLVVHGVFMHVQRVQGSDVAVLAQRIERRWLTQSSPVQRSRHQAWHMLGRWNDQRREVLQWRGAGGRGELLFSWFDAARRPGVPAAAPLRLPPQCEWAGTVEGAAGRGRYAQHTAKCRLALPALGPLLEAALSSHDWIVLRRNGAMWDVARRGEHARVTILPADTVGFSVIVWISAAGESPP